MLRRWWPMLHCIRRCPQPRASRNRPSPRQSPVNSPSPKPSASRVDVRCPRRPVHPGANDSCCGADGCGDDDPQKTRILHVLLAAPLDDRLVPDRRTAAPAARQNRMRRSSRIADHPGNSGQGVRDLLRVCCPAVDGEDAAQEKIPPRLSVRYVLVKRQAVPAYRRWLAACLTWCTGGRWRPSWGQGPILEVISGGDDDPRDCDINQEWRA